MTTKAIKGYKFIVGGKSRPGIVGVKPKSGGVIDEFKSTKLKQLGRTQRKLKSQDKEIGEVLKGAKKRGVARKDLVKGKKFQRDVKRSVREGDKLRKDVLRAGRARGGVVVSNAMRPRDKRKPMDKLKKEREKFGIRKDLKRPTPDQKGLQKLPEKVRNKMGYMKKGGRVKKFPDLSGDGKVTKKDILMGRGVIKKKKFGGGKK